VRGGARLRALARKGSEHLSKAIAVDAGQQTVASARRRPDALLVPAVLDIVGGPTPIRVLRVPGALYRWKVQNGTAEQHVYVQIADALRPDGFEEPLRSAIETKGESVLRKLLGRGSVPIRIKITSAGITEVGIDHCARPCSF